MKNIQDLISKYPELFNINSSNRNAINLFGIECNIGWYNLLDSLMSTIKEYCESNNISYISINQIKEKFGGLRFYFYGGDDRIEGMVWLAENLSYSICENCSKFATIRNVDGWLTTLCDDCYYKDK